MTSGAQHITIYVLDSRGRIFRRSLIRRITLERETIEGNSPVSENHFALLVIFLKYLEAKTTLREAGWTIQPRLNTQSHR